MTPLRQILADHGRLRVDVSALSDDDDLYRAGLTSHASVTVMLACESEFDVEFARDVVKRETFASIASLQTVIDGLVP